MTESKNLPLGGLTPPRWVKPIGSGGRALLDLLLKNGAAVQASLPVALGLSQPSIARLVSGFAGDGMVGIGHREATGRGNPSVMLTLAPDFAYGLGVAIDGDSLSLALIDFSGTVRGTRRASMPDRSRSAFCARLEDLRRDLIDDAGIDADRIVGTGVGFGGFTVEGPIRFNPPALLGDWVDADLPATLAPVLGPNLLCDNVGTTAALAESLLGVGRTCSDFAYCYLSNGFGGGLIANGKLMRGHLGNAGDFGGVWWLLDQGYPNLERLRLHVAEAGRPTETLEDLLATIVPETPGVSGWLDEAERPFASLSFLLGHMVSPEKVVIGGRLPIPVASALAERIRMPASPPRNDQPFRLPEIVAQQVEGDAAAIGAALMPMQALFFA